MTSPNDLTDLRGALEDRAVGLDTSGADRVGQIHARVRGVRRRRRAVAAVGVAAVLATVAGVSLIPGDGPGPEPATTIVGVQAPATLTSLGFTYELADGVEGDGGRARIRLAPSEEPRLVSWATSGKDDSVRVRSDQEARVLTSSSGDFDDWLMIYPADFATVVTVSAASGEAGLAVYALGDTRPDGYTERGATFRQSTADGELLGAVVGTAADTDLSTPQLTAPGGEITVREFCSTGDAYADLPFRQTPWLHIVDADGDGGGSCSTEPVPFDNAGGSGSTFSARAGKDLTTRLYVTRGQDGPVLHDPDIVVGLGVYDGSDVATREAGLPVIQESGGHRYRLNQVVASEAGARQVTGTAPVVASPVLVLVRTKGTFSYSSTFGTSRDGLSDTTGFDPTEGGSSFSGVVSPGAESSVTVGPSRGLDGSVVRALLPGQSIDMAFYVRAD